MDKLPHNSGLSYPEQQLEIDSFSTKEEIDKLIGIVRRQYPIMVFILACAVALSLVYLFTTPKQYTAHAMFLIDTTKIKNLERTRDRDEEPPLDDAQVDTEIEVLKSEQIGLQVVKDLKLTDDPEFVGSQTSLFGALFDLIFSPFSSGAPSPEKAVSENALTREALGHFLGNRDIRRVNTTYVLDISYTSLNPGTAAAVANAIAEAYLVGQLDVKYQASTRVAKWLQDRIGELRQQAMAADLAVLQFKEQKNIVDTGGGGGSGDNSGRLLVDQQVTDVNAQLAKARADTAEARARLDRIQVVKSEDIPDAAVTDSLNSSIISQLRTQYLDYSRRYELYAARYGPTHLAVINLQTQLAELRRSMHDELNRIAESYKSNYEIAKAAEESLEKSLAQQIAGSQLTNRERLGLTELEARAKAYHAAHDGFIQRYMELTEQQSLPTTDARVITAATAPGGASSPKISRILFLASVVGLMLSFGVATLRESIDKVFRSTKQVEQLLRTTCLTALPVVKNIIASASTSDSGQSSATKRGGSAKELNRNAGLFRYVIDEPLSSFAEGCRAIKVAADISGSIKKNKVIGITSSLPREGKSTVASNIAELIAHGGRKVMLIDGDLRNPTLTRKLASKADIGLLEVLGGKSELREAIYTDHQSGLAFLPAVIDSRLAHSSEIIASEVFRQLIDELRKGYDYIIIDLPPLAPVVDARATTHIVDSYVFVIEWGHTRTNMVQRQLGSAPEIFERLLGVVLNKANVKILDRYEDYYGGYYYKGDYYGRYGYTK